MKILITGATGLVGQAIINVLKSKNIAYCYLTTSKAKLVDGQSFYWQPKNNEIDVKAFDNVTHIINLAGASISKPWTEKYKKEIIKSRVDSINTLYHFLSNNPHHVQHFVTASAIGVYPSDESKIYDENESATNPNFLGTTVQKWEDAIIPFSKLNITLSVVRIGVVFDKNEGALPQIIKPIQYFIGSLMGNGKQWLSWIHVEDLANLFIHVIEKNLSGIYNACAPKPITNKDLTYLIADKLNRKIVLPPVPKFIMKFILGDRHVLLFDSQNVSSKKIIDSGFEFKYDTPEKCLSDLI